ncbi:EAL domain-containing protein [Abyssibacter profundi]|uniref:EAL domain-containing protein n=1 Tax=Abyssibacter profundi TaxID=2182787 RepID=A0A363UJ56_9GAMM|nr:EAL domain-containing protein [Abyssibacter profundi]PWN55454.1 hypothetical protein DEH80_11710 [Abyssibacter profundi]
MARPTRLGRLHRLGCALLAACAGLASPLAYGAPVNPLAFDRVSLSDGLSQSTVLDMHQDGFGFVWLATENGLNRYDGRTIKTYYRTPGDEGGLGSDYIWAIEEDADGNLWLGTDDAGLIRWNRQRDVFEPITLRGLNGKVLTGTRVSDLLVTGEDEVWIATRTAGVLVISTQGETLAQYLHDQPSPLGERLRRVSSLLRSRDGSVWIGTEQGVHQISADRSTLNSYVLSPQSRPEQAPIDNNISTLMQDLQGRIWVATFESGISRLDPNTGRFTHLTSADSSQPQLAGNRVRAMMQDADSRIWLGTDNGVTLLRNDGTAQQIRHEPANPFSLPNDLVMSLMQDASGLIWIGTRGGGVGVWNPRSWSMGPRTPEELSGVHVNSFLEWENGSTWIGTIGAGLLELTASGEIGPALPPGQRAQLQDSVMSLQRDASGTVWIGTLSAGLLRYDPSHKTLTALPVAPKRKPSEPWQRDAIGAPGIMSLAEGPAGTLWAGTFNGGVARIDSQTLAIERLGFEGELAGMEHVRATALAVAQDSELWIGTEANGLTALDLVTGQVTRYRARPDVAHQLPSDSIYSLHVDTQGDVWVGTAARGLARLSRRSIEDAAPRFDLITTADGLSSNVIFGIEPDSDGHLWLSSSNGLMRYHPATRDVRIFHQGHGTFSDEFNFGAHHRAEDGTLYFGGPGGFNKIDPAALQMNRRPPSVLLTDILLFGESLPNDRPAYLTRAIELDHDQDVLAFEFAATDYTAPERNIYSVKLEGFDREWSTPSTRNRATYTNLDPGRYTLKIRAANSDRVWASAPYELAIEIRHPPWATWWAWLAYVAMAGSLLWLFLRLRFRAQERDARLNQLAYYDRITGLPNRDLFEQRGAEALRRIEGSTDHLVVLCIRFAIPKQIGQSLPHDMANDMWSSLAAQLVRAIHSHEHAVGRGDVARLDADQFVIFMRIAPEQDDLAALTERLKAGWSEGLVVGEHRVSVAAAIGVARAPEHARDIGTLVHYAVTAATAHSSPQPGQVAIYDDEMTSRLESRLLLETRLRQAITQDELELYLQPKFTRARQIVGAEALLRWNSRELGWIPPSTFVPLAEESDLIQDLDAWVIHKTCALLKAWDSPKLLTLRIAINLSAANLNQAHTVRALVQATASAGIDPARIEVELTESALLSDVEQTRDTLRELKEAGFSIALDDFGTGYSSLTHLKSFAIDTVKIDREFVQGVDQAGQEQSICSAIVALARSLGLTTVAEGVETEAQFQTLVGLGCDDIQGYLLAKPMPTGEFRQLVENTAVHEAG